MSLSSESDLTHGGHDGLTDASFLNRGGGSVAIDPGPTGNREKQILGFTHDPSANEYEWINRTNAIAVPDTTLGLGFHFESERILVTLDDEHKLIAIALGQPSAQWTYLPTQVGPIGVTLTDGNRELFAAVLNNRSNTLTLIEASLLLKPNSLINDLTKYRTSLLAAFKQLVNGVFEAMRDCFD